MSPEKHSHYGTYNRLRHFLGPTVSPIVDVTNITLGLKGSVIIDVSIKMGFKCLQKQTDALSALVILTFEEPREPGS